VLAVPYLAFFPLALRRKAFFEGQGEKKQGREQHHLKNLLKKINQSFYKFVINSFVFYFFS
jgi:hypothetical protein